MKKLLTLTMMFFAFASFSNAQSGTVTLSDHGDVYGCSGFEIGITVYRLADGNFPGMYAIDFKNAGACDTCWTHKWDRGFPGNAIPNPAPLYQTWCPDYDQTYSLFGGINPKGAMIRIREHKTHIDLIGPYAEAVWQADRWDDSKWMPWSNTVTLGTASPTPTPSPAPAKGKKK